MQMLRLTRFTADPDRTDELLSRRAALIEAVRGQYSGLLDAKLIQLEDRTWVDVWHWDSDVLMQAALAGAPELPEAGPAFAMIEPLSVEAAALVDHR